MKRRRNSNATPKTSQHTTGNNTKKDKELGLDLTYPFLPEEIIIQILADAVRLNFTCSYYYQEYLHPAQKPRRVLSSTKAVVKRELLRVLCARYGHLTRVFKKFSNKEEVFQLVFPTRESRMLSLGDMYIFSRSEALKRKLLGPVLKQIKEQDPNRLECHDIYQKMFTTIFPKEFGTASSLISPEMRAKALGLTTGTVLRSLWWLICYQKSLEKDFHKPDTLDRPFLIVDDIGMKQIDDWIRMLGADILSAEEKREAEIDCRKNKVRLIERRKKRERDLWEEEMTRLGNICPGCKKPQSNKMLCAECHSQLHPF